MIVEIFAAGSFLVAVALETFLLKNICKGEIVPYPYYLPNHKTRSR